MPKPLADSDVLLMFAALALFVALARLLGDLAARLRQPQVLGELIAGVVVGPSVLGLISKPALQAASRGAHILEPVSWIGIVFLLALTGMETDFATLRRDARPAVSATLGGVAVPLAGGFAFGMFLPQALVGAGGSRIAFASFLALAMSISAVTVIAKVLEDLGQMRRNAAKIILTGGIFDETLGWILLALISGFATAGGHGAPGGASATPQDLAGIVIRAAAFLAGAAFFGRRLVSVIVRIVRDRAAIDDAVFTVTVVLALSFAAITEALGLHQVLGAFVFGVIAGTIPRIDKDTVERVRVITRGFLVPVFFLFAGMKVDLTQLGHRDVLLVAAAFLAIAILGKILGCIAGGILARMPAREALLVGVGMSARGSMEIVLAVLGLSLGILSPAIFSVIVLLSVVTIVVVPPGLRFAFAAFPPSDDERARIEREEQDDRSYTPGVRRVLVPMLHGAQADIGAEAARALARSKAHVEQPLEVVVLHLNGAPAAAARPESAEPGRKLLNEVQGTNAERPVEIEEQTSAERPEQALHDAVRRGFQLVIVGVRADKRNDGFGALINGVVRSAASDVFVVSAAPGFDIDRVKRIIVPLTGKEYALAAGDLAITLASGLGASVRAVSVVRKTVRGDVRGWGEPQRARDSAATALQELRERAGVLGVPFEGASLSDADPSRAILRELRSTGSDLCILGASDQSRRGRPFFGDTPDRLLRASPVPVGLLVIQPRA